MFALCRLTASCLRAGFVALLLGATFGGLPAAAQTVPAPPPEAQGRVALVIGNGAYEEAPLANPVNDARAMAEVLRAAGFSVLLLIDADHRRMQLALREFGERLKSGAGTGLFYFAGHGMQIKGRNFLVPVKSGIALEDEVAYAAMDAQSVLDKMESARSGTNIVILDACRNNPFARSFRGAPLGLVQMDAPVGTLISFATAPGSVAIDNLPGMRNGLFTTHLLEAIRRPGLKLEDVLKQVRGAVLRASANRQVPWESSALVGDFYFHPPQGGAAEAPPHAAPAAPGAVTADPHAAVDHALWDAVKDSRSSAEVFAYLNRFPAGRHAREARRRLLDLAEPQATTAAAASSLAATAVEAAASARAEEIERWGRLDTDSRPTAPKRNGAGFAEGDRFRYMRRNLMPGGGIEYYLWNVDRVESDGSLWVNGGRQRLDPSGQRRSGNDEQTGLWLDFSPPLPIAEAAAKGAGQEQPVTTTVQVRDAEGRLERVALTGTLRTFSDAASGPRGTVGMLPSVRVQVELRGQTTGGAAEPRKVHWIHHYWMAAPLRLPVLIEINEFEDDVPRQRTVHEMVAADQLSAAGASGGAARQ